jgi:hypothetical protein
MGTGWWQLEFDCCFRRRHPEAPRFHQRGEGSGAEYSKPHHRTLPGLPAAHRLRIMQPL